MPDSQKDPKPLGLTEADENLFRNLLARIREHDAAYLVRLLSDTLAYTQPDSTITAHTELDDDAILIRLTLSAKGVSAAAALFRAYQGVKGTAG